MSLLACHYCSNGVADILQEIRKYLAYGHLLPLLGLMEWDTTVMASAPFV